jgi:predicted RNA-binding protein YlxR (DUF448 family)
MLDKKYLRESVDKKDLLRFVAIRHGFYKNYL